MKKEEYLIEKTGRRGFSIPMRLFNHPGTFKPISNPVGWRILNSFASPRCPIDVARDLGLHEQKVYYYINKFKAEGLLEDVKSEQRQGTYAKFYQLRFPAFGVILDKTKSEAGVFEKLPAAELLEPFIKEGRLNATIIVGSPDPHGPWKARASDSCCAIDLALFLGSFIKRDVSPNYKLDVETREADLKNNLILVGGPTVNMVTQKLNSQLPLYFEMGGDRDIISKASNKAYREDECGVVEVIDNPWNGNCRIMLMAGKRFAGTRAAVIACIKHLPLLHKGSRSMQGHIARVVKGFDMDGDGVIDSAEILE